MFYTAELSSKQTGSNPLPWGPSQPSVYSRLLHTLVTSHRLAHATFMAPTMFNVTGNLTDVRILSFPREQLSESQRLLCPVQPVALVSGQCPLHTFNKCF